MTSQAGSLRKGYIRMFASIKIHNKLPHLRRCHDEDVPTRYDATKPACSDAPEDVPQSGVDWERGRASLFSTQLMLDSSGTCCYYISVSGTMASQVGSLRKG